MTNESLRLGALRTIFPNMEIALVPGRSIDSSGTLRDQHHDLEFPDALEGEKVYRVTGPPLDKAEECLASDVLNAVAKPSAVRELRFRVFPLTLQETDLLAVLQYDFLDANPPGSCTSVARLFYVTQSSGRLQVRAAHTFDTTHHVGIQRIRLLDLSGDKRPELIIQSDSGGAGAHQSDLAIFNLDSGQFDQWLNVPAAIYSGVDEEDQEQQYTQDLDIVLTRSKSAQSFCFAKTTYAENGVWFSIPRDTQPCYARFTGPDSALHLQ